MIKLPASARLLTSALAMLLLDLAPAFADGDNAPAPATPEAAAKAATALLDCLSIPHDSSTDAVATYEAILRTAVPGAVFLDQAGWAARQAPSAASFYAGIDLAEDAAGTAVVSAIAPKSPAAATPLAPGDILLSVAPSGAPTTDGHAPISLAQARTLLANGTEAALVISYKTPSNAVPQTLTIDRIPAPALAIEDLPAAIGYVRLLSLSPDADAEASPLADALLAAIADWRNRDFIGTVLDLRGLSGPVAALPVVDAIAAALPARVPDAPLYTLTHRMVVDEVVSAPLGRAADPDAATFPVMVLVDATTDGAAERLAALFAHSLKSALLVGRPTAGNPLLSEAYPYPENLAVDRRVVLPSADLTFPDGATLDGLTPLAPDIPITDAALAEPLYEPDAETITFRARKKGTLEEEAVDRALRDRTRHDPYLRHATDILLGLRAFAR